MTGSQLLQTTLLKTNDFAELQDSAAGWDQRYYQLSPGHFTGSLEMTQIGSTQIFRERWNKKIRYQGTAPAGGFGIALPFAQPGLGNWVGMPTTLNTVILQPPGLEADYVSADYWDALVLSVSDEEAQSLFSAYSEDGEISRQFSGVVDLQPNDADKIRRMGREFLCGPRPVSLEGGRQVSLLSDQFVKLFLWEIVKVQDASKFVAGPAKPATIVKKATDLVLADRTSSVGLTELCAELGVSLRALHYAFQDVTGLSPAAWLRTIRLNRAHETLAMADPNEILIKQVALDNGFLHFGHFSAQYRRFFGCAPTETLHSA